MAGSQSRIFPGAKIAGLDWNIILPRFLTKNKGINSQKKYRVLWKIPSVMPPSSNNDGINQKGQASSRWFLSSGVDNHKEFAVRSSGAVGRRKLHGRDRNSYQVFQLQTYFVTTILLVTW
jgi:hypothetical protein